MGTVSDRAWREARRSGIGGTDVAKILGVDRYGGPLEVWLEKVVGAPERVETEPMWWGRAMESAISRRYMEQTRRRVVNPKRLVRCSSNPVLIGTPDRIVAGERRGVELKNVSHWVADQWGRGGTDEVPIYYWLQCAHYMAVMDYDVWDLAALFDGNRLEVYTINRDRDLEREVLGQVLPWWESYVVERIQPPIDGTESASRFLQRRFPGETSTEILAPIEVVETAADDLARARNAIEEWEERERLAENRIKEFIGDALGVESGSVWRATWKQAKGRRTTDWDAVVSELKTLIKIDGGSPETEWVDALVKKHTKVGEPARRFLFDHFQRKR